MSLEGTLEVTDGEAPTFVFTISNAGDSPVDLQFTDGCKADFVVEGDDELWRYSDGRMFTQVIGSKTLQPGEETSYECPFDGRATGKLTARAELRAKNRDCTASTTFDR